MKKLNREEIFGSVSWVNHVARDASLSSLAAQNIYSFQLPGSADAPQILKFSNKRITNNCNLVNIKAKKRDAVLSSFYLPMKTKIHKHLMTRESSKKSTSRDSALSPATGLGGGGGSTAAMRLIVPLQGVVQGRGGLVLGSLIPCALFYALQLYLKRNRSPSPHPTSDGSEPRSIIRSPSRSVLSTRGSSSHAAVSSRAGSIVKSGDSPYFVGIKRFSEDPYHPIENPNGVMQLGLAENHVALFPLKQFFFSSF